MTEPATISPTFIAVLQRYIAQRGLNAPELTKNLAERRALNRIANQDFDALLYALHDIDPVPALGLRVGLNAQPQDFGVAGYLFAACSTLAQALTRYGRFQTLVFSELKTQVEVSGDVVRHRWNLHDVNTPLSCEFSVAIFIALYQALIGKKIAPVQVGLPCAAPDDSPLYEILLGCPVAFNAECLSVDLPANVMWMTISSSDPYIRKIFDDQAEAMLEELGGKGSESAEVFLERLQEHILMAMKDGDIRASTVAAKMGYSARSFYRLLEGTGYSYRSILAGLRRRLAKRYLQVESLSYSEVAMLLGYSEQSAFTRAFKGWMGITPGEYRKKIK